MLMSYVPIKNKAEILLFSQHQDASVSSSKEKKITVILDCNVAKMQWTLLKKCLSNLHVT